MSLIILRKGDRQKLKERFGMSEPSLSLSLHFKQNSLKARRLRSYAVNHLRAIPIIA